MTISSRRTFLAPFVATAFAAGNTQSSAVKLTQRTAERYQNHERGFYMECVLSREERKREISHVIRAQQYRIVLDAHRVRIDVLTRKHGQITRILDGRRALTYSSDPSEYLEADAASRYGAEIAAGIARSNHTLFQRFADLAASNPTIASAKPATIAVSGKPLACQRIKVMTPTGMTEVWIEEASALVRRSTMKGKRDGWRIDESIEWTMIEPLTNGEAQITNWRPPAGSARLSYLRAPWPECSEALPPANLPALSPEPPQPNLERLRITAGVDPHLR